MVIWRGQRSGHGEKLKSGQAEGVRRAVDKEREIQHSGDSLDGQRANKKQITLMTIANLRKRLANIFSVHSDHRVVPTIRVFHKNAPTYNNQMNSPIYIEEAGAYHR